MASHCLKAQGVRVVLKRTVGTHSKAYNTCYCKSLYFKNCLPAFGTKFTSKSLFSFLSPELSWIWVEQNTVQNSFFMQNQYSIFRIGNENQIHNLNKLVFIAWWMNSKKIEIHIHILDFSRKKNYQLTFTSVIDCNVKTCKWISIEKIS